MELMILGRPAILDAVKSGRIIIEPFSEDQVGPASIDLTLASEFRVFKKQTQAYRITERADPKTVTEVVVVQEAFLLQSGETVLGMTREIVTLAPTLAGRLEGRSRFARVGLMVHISSNFVNPGVSNRQVLEMSNLGPTTLLLVPGTRICQLIVEEVTGEARYAGMYQKQLHL